MQFKKKAALDSNVLERQLGVKHNGLQVERLADAQILMLHVVSVELLAHQAVAHAEGGRGELVVERRIDLFKSHSTKYKKAKQWLQLLENIGVGSRLAIDFELKSIID